MNDIGLSLTRCYKNIINDYFSQTVIDVLLGNVTASIFDDFEATMMSSDPGISVGKIRENAIDSCSKIVVQHPEEVLIHGWAMLTPVQTNTLRTLPLEEALLLLTNQAIYGCKFDWITERVVSFERIDLCSITKIHYGTYVTSTLSEGQMDEGLNVGIVVSYAPGQKSIKRVNTRSLQVAAATEAEDEGGGNRESALLSWLRSQRSDTHQFMAMKVIPRGSLAHERINLRPRETAERICNQIQRAIKENADPGAKGEVVDMVREESIISLTDARNRTGYLEQIGHSIKKFVWA